MEYRDIGMFGLYTVLKKEIESMGTNTFAVLKYFLPKRKHSTTVVSTDHPPMKVF